MDELLLCIGNQLKDIVNLNFIGKALAWKKSCRNFVNVVLHKEHNHCNDSDDNNNGNHRGDDYELLWKKSRVVEKVSSNPLKAKSTGNNSGSQRVITISSSSYV
jgi:hypothetical protein